MTELDRLPPDQRAVLSLVLDRGKSYAEVAAMLSIPEATVRDRAHTALDALARAGAAGDGELASAGRPTPPPRRSSQLPSSRLGGALLLGAVVVAAVVVAIVLSSGGKGSPTSPRSPARTTPAAGGGTARIDKKLTLSPVEPESRAAGEAYVLSDGGRRAFYVAAKDLPASQSHGFFYAVWLYNSPSSSAPLGRAPAVTSNGRLEGGGPLPSNAADYAKLIVTRETSTRASHPGPIVLSGSFSLT